VARPQHCNGRRPTKMTDGIIAEVSNGISHGLSDEDAAALVGIEPSTLFRWKKRPEFAKAIKQAVARRKLIRLQKIDHGDPGWQGSAWHMERAEPLRFARPEIMVQLNQLNVASQKAANLSMWSQPLSNGESGEIEFTDPPWDQPQQHAALPEHTSDATVFESPATVNARAPVRDAGKQYAAPSQAIELEPVEAGEYGSWIAQVKIQAALLHSDPVATNRAYLKDEDMNQVEKVMRADAERFQNRSTV
jgi:hypothetical protein